jgi:hypothetical protein
VDDAKKELIEKADKKARMFWCSRQGTPTIKFTVRPISTRKNNVIAATPEAGWPFPLLSRQISS